MAKKKVVWYHEDDIPAIKLAGFVLLLGFVMALVIIPALGSWLVVPERYDSAIIHTRNGGW